MSLVLARSLDGSGRGGGRGGRLGWHPGPVVALFSFPALGGLLFGYDIGAVAYALLSLQDATTAGVPWGADLESSSLLRGFYTSSVVGGALLGTLVVLKVERALGRRRELMVAAALYALGALAEFASGFKPWGREGGLVLALAGRWVYGCGIGFAMHAAPAYIAEMSPPAIRGTLVALKEACIVLGILLGQVAGFAFRDAPDGGWRWAFFIPVPLACVMGAGMACLPASARWLALRGRWDEAEDSLRFFMRSGVGACIEEIQGSLGGGGDSRAALLGGGGGDDGGGAGSGGVVSSSGADSSGAVQQLEAGATGGSKRRGAAAAATATTKAAGGRGCWALLDRRYRRPLVIGLGVVTLQQISGQPSVLYYTGEIFKNFGVSDAATLGVGGFKLLATLLAVLGVERYGRRRLLLAGTALMLAALCTLTATFHYYEGSASADRDEALDVVLLLGFFIYIAGYQVGFGPIAWLLISEIFQLEVRGTMVGIAVCTNFFWNLVVTLLFDETRRGLGTSATFGLFAAICGGALAFVFFLVPETKGLSLEEIEVLLSSSSDLTSGPQGAADTNRYYLHHQRPDGLPVISWATVSSFFASCLPGGGRRRGASSGGGLGGSGMGAPRPRTLSQQGSNGQVLPFIETLLPVEKKATGDSTTSKATTMATMAGAGGDGGGNSNSNTGGVERMSTISV